MASLLPDEPFLEKGGNHEAKRFGLPKFADIHDKGPEIKIAAETREIGWRIDSRTEIIDSEMLRIPLIMPLVGSVVLQTRSGKGITARNAKGVTIRDALDAIRKLRRDREVIQTPFLNSMWWEKGQSYVEIDLHDVPITNGFCDKYKEDEKKGEGEEDEDWLLV